MIPLRSLLLGILSLSLALPAAPAPATAEAAISNPRISGDGSVGSTAQFSPDSSTVVYREELPDGSRHVFSAPSTGGAAPLMLSPAGFPADYSVEHYQISPDGTQVAFLFGHTGIDWFQLYSAPIGGGAITTLTPALPAGRSVSSMWISPNSAQVVYLADQDINDVYELYRVPLTGGPSTRLSNPLLPGRSVSSYFRISADGGRVVYRADQDGPGIYELFSAPMSGGPAIKLNDSLVAGRYVASFDLTPDGSQVVYRADQDINDVYELYRVPLTGGLAVKLNNPIGPGRNVSTFRVSPDGSQVIYQADQDVDEEHRLYSASLTTPARTALTPDLGPDRDVQLNIVFSSDGRWVLHMADRDVNDLFGLYAVAPDGGPSVLLSGTAIGPVSYEYAVSPDGSGVAFRANLDGSGVYQLYGARLPDEPPAAPAVVEPTPLSGPLPPGASINFFDISPDGERVLYTTDSEQDETYELYHVPADGGPSLRLNGDLPPGGDVVWMGFSPNGRLVVYGADQQQDELFSLYAAYEEAPLATISGPAAPAQPGVAEVTVSLSKPMLVTQVSVRLTAAAGDAVPGRDYSLPGGAGQVVVEFAPGETSKVLPVTVLDNPERSVARTVALQLSGTATAELDEVRSVELVLAPYGVRFYLPLTVR